MPVVIHLIRHGESEWNASRRVQGQTMAVALTEKGRQQARSAAQRLGPIDELWTSDQLRASQTADIIGDHAGLIPTPRRELREQGLGTLEGHPFEEALKMADGFDWTDPDSQVPGGESLREVYQRLSTLFAGLSQEPSRTIAVVSHGDTIRVARALLAGHPVERVGPDGVANGSTTTVTVET
ncbi:MAG: histidine phosphatase family protein [Pseudonocardiales bacterium]|nr:histidine phosphatase family protein [Pseudonocardiales bacterium]